MYVGFRLSPSTHLLGVTRHGDPVPSEGTATASRRSRRGAAAARSTGAARHSTSGGANRSTEPEDPTEGDPHRASCEALLGIGHLHRGNGRLSKQLGHVSGGAAAADAWRRRRRGSQRDEIALFGSDYTSL